MSEEMLDLILPEQEIVDNPGNLNEEVTEAVSSANTTDLDYLKRIESKLDVVLQKLNPEV